MASILVVFLLLSMSACSLREDAAALYKQEAPLEVEIHTEPAVQPGQPTNIKAVLTQQGHKIGNADFVHVEIQKQDGTIVFPMEEANDEGKGVYSLTAIIEESGLYYVRIHAGNNGSLISPRKQIVVGELTDSEIKLLKQGQKMPTEPAAHHH